MQLTKEAIYMAWACVALTQYGIFFAFFLSFFG